MRRPQLVLLAVAASTAVLGCSATPSAPTSVPVEQPVRVVQPGPATQSSPASPSDDANGRSQAGRRDGRDGGGGSTQHPIAALPVGFPLPPGVVTAISSGPSRWSVLMVMNGSAQQAQASAVAFYLGRGFRRDSAYAVHGRGYQISMIAENRDHSATESNLTLVVKGQT